MSKDLLQTLKSRVTTPFVDVASDEDWNNKEDAIRLPYPILNIAHSGSIFGGFRSGLIVLAGKSKSFKSNIMLIHCAAYQKKYKDSVTLFFDNEFGTTKEYMRSFGIDTNRVLHIKVRDVEELKVEVTRQLDDLLSDYMEAKKKAPKSTDTPKVFVMIDSLGNIASRKEVTDAVNDKSTVDMTRAKQLKSFTRIINPYLELLKLPCVAIQHVYSSMDLFPKDVVSGGTGSVYSSNTLWIISRRQNKDKKTGLTGFDFRIKIEKGRDVVEQSIFTFTADFKKGVNPWSGLLEIALEFGWVIKPSNGWYSRGIDLDKETGELTFEDKKWRMADTNCKEFWMDIIKNPEFNQDIRNKYELLGIQVEDVELDANLKTEVVDDAKLEKDVETVEDGSEEK